MYPHLSNITGLSNPSKYDIGLSYYFFRRDVVCYKWPISISIVYSWIYFSHKEKRNCSRVESQKRMYMARLPNWFNPSRLIFQIEITIVWDLLALIITIGYSWSKHILKTFQTINISWGKHKFITETFLTPCEKRIRP